MTISLLLHLYVKATIIFNKKNVSQKIQRVLYFCFYFSSIASDIIIYDAKKYTKSISLRDGSTYSHEEIWKFPHRNRRYSFKGKNVYKKKKERYYSEYFFAY